MAEPNFFAVLSANSAVEGEVAERIHPDMVPEQGAMPAIVWQRMGSDPRQVGNCGSDPLVMAHYQVAVYALSRTVAIRVAAIVRDTLLDFKGMMGDAEVKACSLVTDFDTIDPDPGLLCRTQLWDVWYVER